MGRPTLTSLTAFLAVFAAQRLTDTLGFGVAAFALAVPLTDQPWTLVLSVYAHANVTHLVANALALLLVGPVVGYVTTPARFHAFFVASGVVAGVAQVLVSAPFGTTSVLGASGAIFALLGYLLFGNVATQWVLSWLPLGAYNRVLLVVFLAVVVTLATAAPGVALVAHFTGFVVGAAAGRLRLLHKSRTSPATG